MSNLKLSDNFYYSELVKSSTALRLGIDNDTSDPETIENAKALAKNIFQPIRAIYGPFSPPSWYRCEELEKVLCKDAYHNWCVRNGFIVSERSWKKYFDLKSHPKGEAGDIEVSGVSNDRLYEWIKKNLKFDQLIREYRKKDDPNSGWVHVSFSRTRNRNEAFSID